MEIHIALVFVALTNGLWYARANFMGLTRIPVSHPLDGPTGAFYVKGPVTGHGGLESCLKVLRRKSAGIPARERAVCSINTALSLAA